MRIVIALPNISLTWPNIVNNGKKWELLWEQLGRAVCRTFPRNKILRWFGDDKDDVTGDDNGDDNCDDTGDDSGDDKDDDSGDDNGDYNGDNYCDDDGDDYCDGNGYYHGGDHDDNWFAKIQNFEQDFVCTPVIPMKLHFFSVCKN